MKKRGTADKEKNISLTIILITIILAIFLSLFISFLTLNFFANSAESLDTGRIIVHVTSLTGIQQGRITVELEDKLLATNNGK